MNKIYLVILSVFLSTAATAQGDIGKFWKAKKTTIDSKKAHKGTKIKLGQLIKTSNSSRAKAEIMTVDDSRYLIFKNTTIKFDRLDMDGEKCKGLRATLVSGKIRSTSGSCGDGKTEIKTSLGAAFAWGTDYDLVYIPEGEIIEGYEDVAPGFYQKVNEGQVKVSNDAGSIMVNPGESAFMSFNNMLAPSYIPTPKFFTKPQKVIGKPTNKLKKKLKEIQDREKTDTKKAAEKPKKTTTKKKPTTKKSVPATKEAVVKKAVYDSENQPKPQKDNESNEPAKKKSKILFGLIEVDEDSVFAWMGSSNEEKDPDSESVEIIDERVIYYDPEEEDQEIAEPKDKVVLPEIPTEDPVKPIEEEERHVISRSNIIGEVVNTGDLLDGKTTSTTPTYERIMYSDGTQEDILKSQSIEVFLLTEEVRYGDERTQEDKSPVVEHKQIDSGEDGKDIQEYYKSYNNSIYKNGYKYSSKTKKSKVIDAIGGIIEPEKTEIIYENRKDADYIDKKHIKFVQRQDFLYREVKTTTNTLSEWKNHGEKIIIEIADSETKKNTISTSSGKTRTTDFHRLESVKQPQIIEKTTMVVTEYLDAEGRESADKIIVQSDNIVDRREEVLGNQVGRHLYTMRESDMEDISEWENDGIPVPIGTRGGQERATETETSDEGISRTKHYYVTQNEQAQKRTTEAYTLIEKFYPSNEPWEGFINEKNPTGLYSESRTIAAPDTRGNLKRVVLSGREDLIFNNPILTGDNIVVTEGLSGMSAKFKVEEGALRVISESLYDDLFHTVNSAANGVDTIEIEVSIDGAPNVNYQITPTDKRSDYSSFLSTRATYKTSGNDVTFETKMKVGTPTNSNEGVLSGYLQADVPKSALGLSDDDKEVAETIINHGGSTIYYGVGNSRYQGTEPDEQSAYIYEGKSNDLNLSGDDIGMKLPTEGEVEYDLVPEAQSKILITGEGLTERDDAGRYKLKKVDLEIDFGKSVNNVEVTTYIEDSQKNEVYESHKVKETLKRAKNISGSKISGIFSGSSNGSEGSESITDRLVTTTKEAPVLVEDSLEVVGVMMGNKGSHVGLGYNQAIDVSEESTKKDIKTASGTALLQARTYDGEAAPTQPETEESVVFADLSSSQSSDNDSSWGWWKEEADRIDQELGTENPSIKGDIGTTDGQTQNLYSSFIRDMDSNEPMNLRKSGSIDYDVGSNTNLTINAANGSEVSDKYHLSAAGLNINFGNSDVDTTITVSEKDSSGQLVNSITGSDSGFLNMTTGKFEIDGGYMNKADELENDISQGMFGARGKVLDDQGSRAGMEFKMAVEDIDANNPLNNNTVMGVILFEEKK